MLSAHEVFKISIMQLIYRDDFSPMKTNFLTVCLLMVADPESRQAFFRKTLSEVLTDQIGTKLFLI